MVRRISSWHSSHFRWGSNSWIFPLMPWCSLPNSRLLGTLDHTLHGSESCATARGIWTWSWVTSSWSTVRSTSSWVRSISLPWSLILILWLGLWHHLWCYFRCLSLKAAWWSLWSECTWLSLKVLELLLYHIHLISVKTVSLSVDEIS